MNTRTDLHFELAERFCGNRPHDAIETLRIDSRPALKRDETAQYDAHTEYISMTHRFPLFYINPAELDKILSAGIIDAKSVDNSATESKQFKIIIEER